MGFAFAIPIIPSLFSTTPNRLPILFVPNVQFLTDFVNGEIGIAKKLKNSAFLKILAGVPDPATLNTFLKASGGNIGNNPGQFFQNGKMKPPTSVSFDTSLSPPGGLEALEKSMIQAIFETQKPYVTIIKLVIEHFIDIEDIIACILGIIMSSKKPAGNPKALGYQGQQDGGGVSAGLNNLNQLQKKKGPKNKLSDNKITPETIPTADLPTESLYDDGNYQIFTQSIVYSTREFRDDTTYTYLYKDVIEQDFRLIPGTSSIEIEEDADEGLDQSIVFAVFDDQWEFVDMDEINKKIPWVKRRMKANGAWPQLKPEQDFDFVYTTGIPGLPDSVGLPGRPEEILGIKLNWYIKRYREEGPSIDTEDGTKFIKKGLPMIAYNTNKINTTFDLFRRYYVEYADQKIQQSLGTSSQTMEDDDGKEIGVREYSRKTLNGMLSDFSDNGMLSNELEGVLENNFMNLSKNNTNGLQNIDKFEKVAYAFKPFKFGNLWYYPDGDYDLKIIKCDSTTDITFSQTVGQPELKAKILRFVDRAIDFQFLDGQTLNILVFGLSTQGFVLKTFINQSTLSFDYYGDKFQFVEGNLELDLATTKFTFFTPQIDNSLILRPWIYNNTQRFSFIKSPNSDEYTLKTERLRNGSWIPDTAQRLIDSPFDGDILVLPGYATGEIIYKVKWKNGVEILINNKKKYRGKIIDININNFIPNGINTVSRIRYDFETNSILSQTQETLPNLIRIDDFSTGTAKKRIISKANITNEALSKAELFGKGPYGSPIVTDEPGGAQRQTVEQIYRFQTSADDTKTYYIIEGVAQSQNKNPLQSPNEIQEANNRPGVARKGGGSGSYRFPSCIFKIIKKFIKLLIKVFAKLFPAIQQFITLIKNPIKFITDILIAKIGDDFGAESPRFVAFTKDFLSQLKRVQEYIDKLKSVQNLSEQIRDQAQDEVEQYLNSTFLKDFVYVKRTGEVQFLFDGSAIIKLFGDAPILKPLPTLTFGLQTNFGSLLTRAPKVPIKLIFEIGGKRSPSGQSLDKIPGYSPEIVDKGLKKSALIDGIFDPVLSVNNQIISKAGDQTVVQQVSTLYSTGIFRADYQYKYTEVTQEVLDLVTKATQLEGIGDRDSLSEAKRLLEEAKKKDPNNDFIAEKIEALDGLQKLTSTHPLLDFLLNILCLPLKVIIGIILYILNFFKSLKNPFTLPKKIIEFISFKWMLDFFNPTSPNSMFAMAGLLFNIETFFLEWIPQLKMGTKFEFNMNDIVKLPWATLPTYTLKQFKDLIFGMGLSKPPKLKFPFLPLISAILCLIEAIINGFIDFVWALVGLVDPKSGRWIVLKPPYLNFCRNSNDQITVKDMMDIMNGNFAPPRPSQDGAPSGTASSSGAPASPSYNFVFDITTSDGRNVKDLNQQELDKWMEENKDLEFSFDF
jgi:hypothetical protein